METEIEAKFLGVDHNKLRDKLASLGAELVNPERLMRRRNFDFADGRLEKTGGWVRVRDEGDKVTLSYKQLSDRTLHGTKEVSVKVDDFEKCCQLLESIGLKQNSYQETKRESWRLGSVQVELDEWPWVKPFVELEAENEHDIKEAVTKLGLDFSKAVHGSVEIVYMAEYNVTEAEVDAWQEIKFVPVPDWLKKLKK